MLIGLAGASLFAGAAIPRKVRARSGSGHHPLLLLKTNALHTDIAVPATPMVRRRLAFLSDVGIPIENENLTHVLVGWGGKGFYPNNSRPHRISLVTLFNSILGDESVLRFAPLSVPAGQWDGSHLIPISDDALDGLMAFIERTLQRDEDGRFRPLDHPGIIDLDHFFKARPTFAAAVGCNVWVSEALAEAGVGSGRWTPVPQTLIPSVDKPRRASIPE